ncbi:hypothetical protein KKC32_03490 [Patescibacteria group bacterium]|nr:hypothetical protein [Patescibacteria group bacterium]
MEMKRFMVLVLSLVFFVACAQEEHDKRVFSSLRSAERALEDLEGMRAAGLCKEPLQKINEEEVPYFRAKAEGETSIEIYEGMENFVWNLRCGDRRFFFYGTITCESTPSECNPWISINFYWGKEEWASERFFELQVVPDEHWVANISFMENYEKGNLKGKRRVIECRHHRELIFLSGHEGECRWDTDSGGSELHYFDSLMPYNRRIFGLFNKLKRFLPINELSLEKKVE